MPQIEPHLFVVFGATGDLARRKLLPALFRQIRSGALGDACYLFGVGREDIPDAEFRDILTDALDDDEHGLGDEEIRTLTEDRAYYYGLGKDDKDYAGLRDRIERVEGRHGLSGNRVFYLSIPPEVFQLTIEGLADVGLNRSAGWTRIVVEKPFGRDYESARALNDLVHRYYDEEQVFRIDHFLGKETVQNLLAFRFANLLFEKVWNRDVIEQVEITAAETLGLAGRAGYYDDAGALRDMIQNHLTQLFTLVAIEPPSQFTAHAIQREKLKVLDAVRSIDPEADVVFGQYAAGEIDGEAVPGYDDEEGIEGDSDTETFAAVRLYVDNWRWQGVPFYLRSGKRMPETCTRIAIRFRCAPVSIFQPHQDTCALDANVLLVTLKPDEGFDIRFEVKTPGEPFVLETQTLTFRYDEAFDALPKAYETLLVDVVQNDPTLFVQAEAAWKLYDPILENRPPVHPYPAGAWGPDETKRLLQGWTAGGG